MATFLLRSAWPTFTEFREKWLFSRSNRGNWITDKWETQRGYFVTPQPIFYQNSPAWIGLKFKFRPVHLSTWTQVNWAMEFGRWEGNFQSHSRLLSGVDSNGMRVSPDNKQSLSVQDKATSQWNGGKWYYWPNENKKRKPAYKNKTKKSCWNARDVTWRCTQTREQRGSKMQRNLPLLVIRLHLLNSDEISYLILFKTLSQLNEWV